MAWHLERASSTLLPSVWLFSSGSQACCQLHCTIGSKGALATCSLSDTDSFITDSDAVSGTHPEVERPSGTTRFCKGLLSRAELPSQVARSGPCACRRPT